MAYQYYTGSSDRKVPKQIPSLSPSKESSETGCKNPKIERHYAMDAKDPRRNSGLHGSVTGTITGDPLSKMVKNGTVPMLGMNLVYEEYDGSSSFCRVTLFGNQAQAADGKLKAGQAVTAEGTVRMNTWDKNGETRHGLSMLASRVEPVGDGSPYAGTGNVAGRNV